jgi:glutathione S-transferase
MKVFHESHTRSSRIIWLLNEAKIPFEVDRVDLKSGKRSPELLLASPMGKVPAIQDGPVAMSESGAIALYIADKYSTALAPAIDSPLRGRFLYWMFFTPAVIEPVMVEKATGTKPNKYRNGWGSFEQMVETLEAGLADSDWLLGDRFSAADVMVGSSVLFLQQFGMLPESTILSAYAKRCSSRQAYQDAIAMDAAPGD